MSSSHYFIYHIINLITRKFYIGKTRVSVSKRWREHLYAAKRHQTNGCIYLCNSMVKYGIENFEIKQIDEAYDYKHSVFLENFYIQYYQSFDSKYGYNLMVDNFDKNGGRLLSRATRLKKAHSMYSIPCNQRTKGVTWDEDRQKWLVRFKFLEERVQKRFDSKEEAMITYDKLALYRYGENACLFFPQNKDQYLVENLREFYEQALTRRVRQARFKGVSISGSSFLVKICGTGHIPYLHIGSYHIEEEAAIAYDKVHMFLGRPIEETNFPERYADDYLSEGKKIYDKFTSSHRQIQTQRGKNSKYNGVCRRKDGWEMCFQHNHVRIREYFIKEIDAAQAYDFYARREGIKNAWLNFPETTILEKPSNITYGKGGNHPNKLPIQIVETLQTFDSIRDMVRKWGSCIETISLALKDSNKTVKGIHLRYFKA